jgi:hypothetical protein
MQGRVAGNIAEFAGASAIPSAGVVARSSTPFHALVKEALGVALGGEGAAMGEELAPEGYKGAGSVLGSLSGPMAAQGLYGAATRGGGWIKKEASAHGFQGFTEEARRKAGAIKAAKELAPQLSTPAVKDNIAQAQELANKVPGLAEGMTLGRATNSPVIQSMEKHFGGTNPQALEMGQARKAQLDKALGEYKDARFPQVEAPPAQGAVRAFEQKAGRLDEGITRLERQERALADRYRRGDQEEVGAALRDVRGELMQKAKAAANERYTAVYDAARKAGLQVDMADVEALARQIDRDAGGAFQGNLNVINEVMNRYSNNTAADFAEFHSLYKRTNAEAGRYAYAASRNADPEAANKARLIGQLGTMMREKLNHMAGPQHGEVGALLADANRFYDTKYRQLFRSGVGGEMGVMGRFGPATEDAKLVPKLIFRPGDASGVVDFMAMAQGDSRAYRTLESGIMDVFAKEAGASGRFTPESIRAFLNKYKEPLDALPGVRKSIATVDRATQSLAQARASVVAEQKALGKSVLKRIAGADNADAIVPRALSSPKTMDALFAHATEPGDREALARAVVEHVVGQKEPFAYMVANRKVLERSLGPRQYNYLTTLTKAQELASRVEPPKNLEYAKLGDPLEEKIGTSIPQAVSDNKAVMNRFGSKEWALARIGMRWWNKANNAERDRVLMEAIYNPDMAMALAKHLEDPTAKSAKALNPHLLTFGLRAAAHAYTVASPAALSYGQLAPPPDQ